MPEGAVAYDLENIPAFREYVAANVGKWYKFVNGVRGREAKNGDVRLVIGCDKTTSWGMAALSNVTQHKVSQLKFKATEDSSINSTRPPYTWDYSGMAEVKVGPDIKEINALRCQAFHVQAISTASRSYLASIPASSRSSSQAMHLLTNTSIASARLTVRHAHAVMSTKKPSPTSYSTAQSIDKPASR
jgi:hypothetical protein